MQCGESKKTDPEQQKHIGCTERSRRHGRQQSENRSAVEPTRESRWCKDDRREDSCCKDWHPKDWHPEKGACAKG
ncbi:hypothetical protein NBRC116593_18820 [Sulfitobacter pacificus]